MLMILTGCSWTFMTWIVVGRGRVVVIYSSFESSDFNDEIVVLFGEVTFWATVLVSVSIALGPYPENHS
jgi:phospholipid-translocating ATPase